MMSEKNKSNHFHVPKVLYENRYCNQAGFSILICGGQDRNGKSKKQVLEVKFPGFEAAEFPSMVKRHSLLRATTINSGIFAIVEDDTAYREVGGFRTSIEIYSEKTKTWKHQYVNSEERFSYSICSFMRKLCIVGGRIKSSNKN